MARACARFSLLLPQGNGGFDERQRRYVLSCSIKFSGNALDILATSGKNINFALMRELP